jgi:hypothetical protein|tara:strand:- start:19 stop:945 length:927 start_codon:yes stop_codon:yes gene_type:complete
MSNINFFRVLQSGGVGGDDPPFDSCVSSPVISATLSTSIISPTSPAGRQVFMRENGLSFYVQRSGDRTVSQASLATANDPTSTISFVNVSPTITSIPQYKFEGVRFSSDGSKMFIGDGSSANFKIHRFILSTSWDITTASSTSDQQLSFTNGGGGSDSVTFVFNSDGTKIFALLRDLTGLSGYASIKFVLTTPYDLSTAGTPTITSLNGLFGLPGMTAPTAANTSAFFPNAVNGDDYIILGGSNASTTVFANDVTVSDFVSNSGTSSCNVNNQPGFANSSDKRYLYNVNRSSAGPPFIWTLRQYSTGL